MLTAGAAAEVASCYHNAALRKVRGNVLIHAAQAVTSDLLRIGDSQKAARVDLVGIDVVANDNDVSCDFCFHDG